MATKGYEEKEGEVEEEEGGRSVGGPWGIL